MQSPAELAKPNSEHAHQRAIFQWATVAHWLGFDAAWNESTYSRPAPLADVTMAINPDLHLLHAIHNQGHGDKVHGARAKAEGVKAGIPDMFLPAPRYGRRANYHGLYIELKRPLYANRADGGLSEDQMKIIRLLRYNGYAVKVAYGWEDACMAIEDYIERSEIRTVR